MRLRPLEFSRSPKSLIFAHRLYGSSQTSKG
jgi:hypothetical protein